MIGCRNENGTLVIPDKMNGKEVSFGKYFTLTKDVTNVIMPERLKGTHNFDVPVTYTSSRGESKEISMIKSHGVSNASNNSNEAQSRSNSSNKISQSSKTSQPSPPMRHKLGR